MMFINTLLFWCITSSVSGATTTGVNHDLVPSPHTDNKTLYVYLSEGERSIPRWETCGDQPVLTVVWYVHWIWYSDWHRRVPQHPVASIQPINDQWLLPDPHWTTSPSLLTNMLKFRSTPITCVQNCTSWLTVSNNWVHWWPDLPVSCGSLWHWEILANFCWTPPIFSGRIFRCDHDMGTQ